MTTKKKIETIETWLKEDFNQNAYVEESDPRIGRKYAVATPAKTCGANYWTDWLSIDTLMEVVRMLRNYNSFIKIKEA